MPVPVPSMVLLSAIVGVEVVELQHTPRLVIVPPPSLEIVPPLKAVFCVIEEAVVVEPITGTTTGLLVKLT